MLTAERLREVLEYDPESGHFRWLVSYGRARVGAIAGSPHNRGYIRIIVDQKFYLAHRLAWLWMAGVWPEELIDHKDGNRKNNQFSNLRQASHSQNRMNSVGRASSSSGMKGAYFHKGSGKWQSFITLRGQTIWIGLFDTPEQAHAAYALAAIVHYGEFARAA